MEQASRGQIKRESAGKQIEKAIKSREKNKSMVDVRKKACLKSRRARTAAPASAGSRQPGHQKVMKGTFMTATAARAPP